LAISPARPVLNEPSDADTTVLPLTEPTSELPVALSDRVYQVPAVAGNDADASVVVAPFRICTAVGVITSA
jgi:hypothetical protein